MNPAAANPALKSIYRPDVGISMHDGDYAAQQAQVGQQAQADAGAATAKGTVAYFKAAIA